MTTLILMLLCLHRPVLYLCTVICFCLEFVSVCMYVCMRVSRMFILHASSACMLLCIAIHVFAC